MQVWVEYEVDGDFILEPSRDTATFHMGPFEVTIRNRAAGEDGHCPGLWVSIVLGAGSLDEAVSTGRERVAEFLNRLTFATSARFKIIHAVRAFEWVPKQVTRQMKLLSSFDPLRPPEPLISADVIGATTLLCSASLPKAVLSALHWFRRAILGTQPDEQFQSFWFVIEILANHLKTTDPAPDLCAKCRSPLFCKTCDKETTHRPYPKQAIEALFRKVVNPEPERAFDFMNDVRNQLLHGKPFTDIETTPKKSTDWIINHIGHTAYAALANTITPIVGPSDKWVLIGRDVFASKVLVMGAVGSFDHKGGRDHPAWKDLPSVQIEMTTGFEPQGG